MSRRAVRKEVLRVLEAASERRPESDGQHVDYLQLLDHFLNDDTPWIGSTACQRVLQKHGVRLGLEAPHLLHAIVAFSASHIDSLQLNLKFRITAVYHYDRLLASFAA